MKANMRGALRTAPLCKVFVALLTVCLLATACGRDEPSDLASEQGSREEKGGAAGGPFGEEPGGGAVAAPIDIPAITEVGDLPTFRRRLFEEVSAACGTPEPCIEIRFVDQEGNGVDADQPDLAVAGTEPDLPASHLERGSVFFVIVEGSGDGGIESSEEEQGGQEPGTGSDQGSGVQSN